MSLVPATWRAEVRQSWFKASPSKSTRPFQKWTKEKMRRGHDSSNSALAQQVQSTEFNSSTAKKEVWGDWETGTLQSSQSAQSNQWSWTEEVMRAFMFIHTTEHSWNNVSTWNLSPPLTLYCQPSTTSSPQSFHLTGSFSCFFHCQIQAISLDFSVQSPPPCQNSSPSFILSYQLPKLCSEKQELRFLLLQCHAPPHSSTLFAL
jgi:hypothetical protein